MVAGVASTAGFTTCVEGKRRGWLEEPQKVKIYIRRVVSVAQGCRPGVSGNECLRLKSTPPCIFPGSARLVLLL